MRPLISFLPSCVSLIVLISSGSLSSSQSSHLLFGASRWNAGSGTEKTLEFVSRKLSDVLQGKTAEISDPPPIDLLCSHISDVSEVESQYCNFRHGLLKAIYDTGYTGSSYS